MCFCEDGLFMKCNFFNNKFLSSMLCLFVLSLLVILLTLLVCLLAPSERSRRFSRILLSLVLNSSFIYNIKI
uniref:Uncharacterized protein n=1 Tax=viral metagenome TaxID=1070528 RepID=A0A6C0EI72_9ZZZZ